MFSHDAPKMCKFVAFLSGKPAHDSPKRCKFVAFLSGKAGLLVTCQKDAKLLHYYVEKQVFS